MIHGYARVSTDGQSVDAQVRQLKAAGACQGVLWRQRHPTVKPYESGGVRKGIPPYCVRVGDDERRKGWVVLARCFGAGQDGVWEKRCWM